jgi:hypothetical protein
VGSTQQQQSVVSGTPEKFKLVLSADEVLALDHYFTWRVGWIGHEDPADLAANLLADLISQRAKEIRDGNENDSD